MLAHDTIKTLLKVGDGKVRQLMSAPSLCSNCFRGAYVEHMTMRKYAMLIMNTSL